MNKLMVVTAFAALLTTKNSRGDTPELPTYTYAIVSAGYKEANIFTSAIHVRIPGTIWMCDVTYKWAGLVARCAAPRTDGGFLPEVITRVSCEKSDTDDETVHLSTLDPGVYASLNISCKRNLYDDGF